MLSDNRLKNGRTQRLIEAAAVIKLLFPPEHSKDMH